MPEGRGTLAGLTVRENLKVGAYLRKDRKGIDADIDYCLDLFPNLKERIKSHGSALSGGEQQMLAVARAVMAKPRLMLLDEASLGLAPSTAKNVYQAIGRLRQRVGHRDARRRAEREPRLHPGRHRDGARDRTQRPDRHLGRAQGHGRDPTRLPGGLTVGTFIQLVIDGLSAGSIYAALALAIVLVNQATGLINFAQGGMAVLAAYFAYSFIQWGVPLILAILLSILVSFVLGALIERFLMRRFEQGDPDTAVVVTIGLLTLITGLCGWIWSFNNLQFPSLFPVQNVNILGAVVSVRSIGTTLVIVGIMILLQLLFIGTKLGLALRAVAVNPQSAAFSGLPVGRLLMVGWGLAAGLGAIAGALIAPSLTLTPGHDGRRARLRARRRHPRRPVQPDRRRASPRG